MLWFLVAGFTAVFLAHGAVSVPARALCPLEIRMARATWHRPADNLSDA